MEEGDRPEQDRASDGSELGDRDYRALSDVRHVIGFFLAFFEQRARAVGLTPQQHWLLLTTRGHESYPDVSITDVAERLQIEHHSASRLVDRSVRRGLLRRTVDPVDRRRALVSLTDEGQRLLDQVIELTRREMGGLPTARFRDSLRHVLRFSRSAQAE